MVAKFCSKVGVLGAVAATLVAVVGIQPAQADVDIAIVGPMSGLYAEYGEQMRQGALQAAADINSSGGVLGTEIDLNIEDDQCDPRRAVAIANFLPGDEVRLVVGHFCSAASIPASKIYEEEGIIQITPAPGDPKLTDQGGDNIFRIAGREDRQAILGAHVLVHYFAESPIAIAHDGGAYGLSLANTVQQVLNERGITETLFEEYAPGLDDYGDLVRRLTAANIAALYVGGNHADAAIIVRQMADRGLRAQVIGSDALATEEFWSIAGESGEGTLLTLPLDPRTIESAEPIIARFRSHRIEPEGVTLYTYAAIQAWAQAVEAAGTFEAEGVSAAMRSESFRTVLGTIVFDENGDVNFPGYVWHKWSNGELVTP